MLRLGEGAELLVFNGRDGEWLARVAAKTKKAVRLSAVEQTRPQPQPSDLVYCFAPLKQGRLDYLVQKAVEMGAGVLQPVITQHTQVAKVGSDRIARQCDRGGRAMRHPRHSRGARGGAGSTACSPDWEQRPAADLLRRGCVHQQSAAGAAGASRRRKLGLLVGPEGGFSDDERRQLRALPFVTAIPLGPRILRADTAAVAALAVIQAAIGDW